jgi:hypothetical protein
VAAGGIPKHGCAVPRHTRCCVFALPLTRVSSGNEAECYLPCEPTRSTLNIIGSCGLFEGEGVSTSRASPPDPHSQYHMVMWAVEGAH